MLLRRITQHVKAQNWFAVGLDFVIVVIGVGVAMMGQQWLGDRQQRADMARVAPAVYADLGSNYFAAKERLSLVQCRVQRYRDIAAKLLLPLDDWTGMPFAVADSARSDEFARKNALPAVLRSPGRPYGSRIWDAEMGRGTFNQMDDERRSSLERAFDAGDVMERLQVEAGALQGGLSLLAVSTTISSSDRQAYYNLLGKLDGIGTGMEAMAGQLIEMIETIGFQGTPQEADKVLAFLAERNEIGRAIYGDCYLPQTWPYFEAVSGKATAP